MEAILTRSVLPPKYVRGTLGKVVVIELHAQELPVERRTSTVSDGVVLLRYIAKAVYVKIDDPKAVYVKIDAKAPRLRAARG